MVPLFKSLFRPSLEYGNDSNAENVMCKDTLSNILLA